MPPKDPDDPGRTVDQDPVADPNVQKSTVDFDHVSSVPDQDAFVSGQKSASARAAEVTVTGYEIEEVLGRGGMGVVYKARHMALKRTVALKMILAGGHADSQQLARFRTEAEAAARLQHPNIVQIHEVGESTGYPYCALEFVAGGDLAGRISQGTLPPREAAELLATLARAMQFAHSRNVVHREMKPANIMLMPDGSPKITDFGLARQMDTDSAQTKAGTVMGTPSYMAPEQASGHTHEAGPAADVYALGAILYDGLAGAPPFKGSSVVETLDMVRSMEPAPLSRLDADIPLDLETICLKCLRKQPEDRYASAAELADELTRFLRGEPIVARPVGHLERGRMWIRRNPLVSGVLALLATVVITAFVVVNQQLQVARNAIAETDRQRRDRALAQVNNLRDAVPGAVSGILEELQRSRDDVLPRLRELWERGGDDRQRIRVALALLPEAPGEVRDTLLTSMLETEDPGEVLLIRDALRSHSQEITKSLWQQSVNPQLSAPQRFRALVALAAFDPHGEKWESCGHDAVDLFFDENSFYHGQWAQAMKPAAPALIPHLRSYFVATGEQRQTAAKVLLEYLNEDLEALTDIVLDADPTQFITLKPALLQHPQRVTKRLRHHLALPRSDTTSIEEEETRARRQAMAAMILLHLGEPDLVWPHFKQSAHPELRSQLIWRVGLFDVDAGLLIERLKQETDLSARRALIVALGDYRDDQVPATVREPLADTLVDWYRNDPDPGIHAAVAWLVGTGQEGPLERPVDWGRSADLQQIDDEFQGREPDGERNWYINGQGQTMVILPGPMSFQMGSPEDEPLRFDIETRHTRKIARTFAIGSHLVSVDQFTRFSQTHLNEQERLYNVAYSPTPDCPINQVSWFTAAQYCNWLSEQEGIPEDQWCYPEADKIRYDMQPFPDYLQRTGYRLATESEWEYACRAGSLESRHYGSSLELLPRYALLKENGQDRTWPVGQKRPNDFGLFDMHGNAWTWVQDAGFYYWNPGTPAPEFLEDIEDEKPVASTSGRVLRGGSYDDRPLYVRAAYRWMLLAGEHKAQVGLRVARTLKP